MLAHLGTIAQERGFEHLELKYAQTAKNQPAYEFIRQVASQWANATEEGQGFKVPANAAASASLEMPPSLAGAAKQITPVIASERVDDRPPMSWISYRIATELRTAQQISEQLKPVKPTSREVKAAFVSPQDNVESTLKTIWEETLQVQPIGADDDYFELGGDSFQAVRIFSEIEKTFGRHLPLITLLEAPTIKQLAGLLRHSPNGKVKGWSPLVPIQPQGFRPPLYCMHAAGGDVLFYRDLAKHLGLEQPLYGLQARGVDRTQTTHDCVEDMATYYLNEIRVFQPEGPYHFGGSSFGGLVAFEMARQLEQQGQAVGLLALFDTYGPGYPKLIGNSSSLRRMFYGVIERVRTLRGSLKLLEPREKIRYVVTKTKKFKRKLIRKFTWKKNEIAIKFSSTTGRPLPKDIQRNHKAIAQALRDYKPQPYSGRLTLFRAESQPVGILPDKTLGWKALTPGGLEIHDVPGFHGAVTVDPHAKFLAEKLAPCLTMAQRESERRVVLNGKDTNHESLELRPVGMILEC